MDCLSLSYSAESKAVSLVERRVKDLKRLELDSSHDRTLLEIEQPYWNHNSGVLNWHDGYLYLSTGDGGNANDPHDFSQNTFSLLGKVLLDIDQTEGALQYGIPEDNPFKNNLVTEGNLVDWNEESLAIARIFRSNSLLC